MALTLSTSAIANAIAGTSSTSFPFSSSSSFPSLTPQHHPSPPPPPRLCAKHATRRQGSRIVAQFKSDSATFSSDICAEERFHLVADSSVSPLSPSACRGSKRYGERERGGCKCGSSLQLEVEEEEEEEEELASATSSDWAYESSSEEDSDSDTSSTSTASANFEERTKTKGNKRQNTHNTQKKIPDFLLPKVAIVGRPNVGKSALFNRLAGRNISIVHDEPGVTRDRLYARVSWEKHEFMVVDTGGVITVPSSESQGSDALAITSRGGSVAIAHAIRDSVVTGLPALIERQAASAVEESLAIIFVVDGQSGITAADLDIAQWLRRKHSSKYIALAVNKCESPVRGLLQTSEFWCLGFTPVGISAITGTGIGDLVNNVCLNLTSADEMHSDSKEEEKEKLAIAIIGKPNVGKSSILNALVGEERTIVSPVSGTTRDSIDTEFTGPNGRLYQLIDTAGIRRRAAVARADSKIESLSVSRAIKAIQRADVVALVIAAMDCVTEQDCKLAEIIEKEGKACVIVVNKWDTVPDKNSKTTLHYEDDVREKLRVLSWAPIVYSSATSNQRINRILEVATAAGEERCKRVSTAILNQVIQEAVSLRQPPTTGGGKKGRIYYCTQAAIRPPTFVFFVNDAKLFPKDYRKYMQKHLRSNVGFPGTPIRLLWRSKTKPERVRSKSRSSEASTRMMAAV